MTITQLRAECPQCRDGYRRELGVQDYEVHLPIESTGVKIWKGTIKPTSTLNNTKSATYQALAHMDECKNLTQGTKSIKNLILVN